MLEDLKRTVCEANLELVRSGLVIQTFGNASGVDRASNCMVIKPSGVGYDGLKPEQMVVVSLATGEVVEGQLRPSSDAPTHLVLYRAFTAVGGIVHTHSRHATAWAQAGSEIPPLGTTHADFFEGPVPCTRDLSAAEIRTDYEANTGEVIVSRFTRLDPLRVPGVLVVNHGPFAWGRTVADAVRHAEALEFIARLASETLAINPAARAMPRVLLDKHFLRKHGPGAYYGQKP
jgi:L-ribulose-5-phosphate 4-epimerase